jgi:prophage maintenance system killer protein
MAAIYAYHLAENQMFIDGNKRTAFAASVVFLKVKNY